MDASDTINVAGRTIRSPMTYVTGNRNTNEASAIVAGLPVGNAQHGYSLPYWPTYATADEHQRARYLDWLAAGRSDPAMDMGYVFIFFYGLERRALVDRADQAIVRDEVKRLCSIHAKSRSFATYASNLLTFIVLPQLRIASESDLDSYLSGGTLQNPSALSTALAWYTMQGKKLPASYAMSVARVMEDAQGGVAVQRAFDELTDLFTIRYRDKFGDGMQLDAGKRPETLAYHAASPSLVADARAIRFEIPHVLGRKAQFKPLVGLWNQCVTDLKKLGTAKRKAAGAPLTAEGWIALPPELRGEYDHPDLERWESIYGACPRVGEFRIITASQLASLGGVEAKERVTGAQLRRVSETAAHLYYSVEPDPRVSRKTVPVGAEFLIWPTTNPEPPDHVLWGSVFTMLSLVLAVALADGALGDEEGSTVGSLIEELFTLDEAMRTRVAAMRHVLTRNPTRVTSLAKKLTASRTPEELAKIGRVLVAVAGADGVITDREYKSLKSLYKALKLGTTELAAAVIASGARLAEDIPVTVRAAIDEERGEALPPPTEQGGEPQLNRQAIAAILAETREVAMMLSSVLDADDDTDEEIVPVQKSNAPPQPGAPVPAGFASLDVRYHGALQELLQKPVWTTAEVRDLATRTKLMPGAILEALNSWSDEQFGDYLITEDGDWRIEAKLIERTN